MRGKNIMLLPMVFMILGAMIVNIGTSQDSTALIYVDPATLPEVGLGHPDDSYIVSIKIADVTDLWTVRFQVQIAKYASVLAISEVNEGDFMKQGGYFTTFIKSIDIFHGVLDIGISRLPIMGTDGASGSGTLATFKLTVLEAGNSPIELIDVEMYDSVGDSIPFEVQSGYYYGLTADLYRFRIGGGWWWWWWWWPRVGTNQTFRSWVINNGDLPLYAKVEFTATKLWPGEETVKFGDGMVGRMSVAPRESEYLYVNGFTADYTDWLVNGSSPYLDAPDDDSYVYTVPEDETEDCSLIGLFEFEDIDLSDGASISNVVLEGYTNGLSNEDVDFDVYTGDFDWLGSLYGAGEPRWVTPRWIGASVSEAYPDALTEEGLNSLALVLHYYDPTNANQTDIIDSLRLRIDFAPWVTPTSAVVVQIPAGEVLELEPAIWELVKDDKGMWVITATCYYSFYNDPYTWHAGERVMTRYFFVWYWPWW